MNYPFSRTHAALALIFSLIARDGVNGANPPQYILDPAFNAPLFTARSSALRAFVLPGDRFLVIGDLGARSIHRINAEVRGSLFRFNADGTLDTTFAIDPQLRDFTVTTLALAPGNKIYVVCVPPPFISADERVFRLHSDGSLDSSFNAGPGTALGNTGVHRIRTIVVDALERVILYGNFGDFSNSGRPQLVRLNPNGAVDQSFAPVTLQRGNNPNAARSSVSHMSAAVQSDGKVIITGTFTVVNGVARHQIARLNTDGTLDTGFVPAGYTTASRADCVAIQPDGKIVFGGRFLTAPNAPARHLIRLDGAGARDTGFNVDVTAATSPVYALKLLPTGEILLNAAATPVRRYASNGSYDSQFAANAYAPGAGISLYSVDTQSNGKIIYAGDFIAINNEPYPGFARLEANGLPDSSLQHAVVFEREALPKHIAVRSDGKIAVSGEFDRVNGFERIGTALLNQDGSLDGITFPSFGVYFPPALIIPPGLLLLPNDQLLLFGQTTFQNDIVADARRVNADGTADSSFIFGDNSFEANHVLRDDAGRFVLSAGWSPQSVVDRIFLARAFDHGALDESFLFGADLVVRFSNGTLSQIYVGENRALATLAGGKVLAKYFDGAKYQILRLEADSFPDETFNEGAAASKGTSIGFPVVFDAFDPGGPRQVQPPNGAIEATSLGPTCVLFLQDGRMILGGEFVSYNGAAAGGLAQLSEDGTLLSTFGTGVSFATAPANPQREPSVRALELESSGRILALGDFDRYNGAPASGLIRIDVDGARDASFASPLLPRSSGTTFTENPLLAREAGGSFLVVGNYAATPNTSAATSIFRLLPVPVAVSRQIHGDAGSFDVNLPFNGTAGVECRNGGGNYQIVVKFPGAVSFAGASVTSGTGSVSTTSGNGTDELTINLTGVTNAQTISLTIAGVNDGGSTKDVVVRMSLLVGDSNGSGVVNSGDAQQTRNRSGQTTDGSNFRSDFNLDGSVNSGDVVVVRGRSGSGL